MFFILDQIHYYSIVLVISFLQSPTYLLYFISKCFEGFYTHIWYICQLNFWFQLRIQPIYGENFSYSFIAGYKYLIFLIAYNIQWLLHGTCIHTHWNMDKLSSSHCGSIGGYTSKNDPYRCRGQKRVSAVCWLSTYQNIIKNQALWHNVKKPLFNLKQYFYGNKLILFILKIISKFVLFILLTYGILKYGFPYNHQS